MRLKPVRHVKEPQYPMNSIVALRPEILNRLPERWKKSRRVAAAASILATLAFSLSGCMKAGPLPSGSPSLSPSASAIEDAPYTGLPAQPSSSPSVSAIEDSPYTGLPAPRGFLSEADAMGMIQKISGDLFSDDKEYGLSPSEAGKKVKYLSYNFDRQRMEEVNLLKSKKSIAIDVFIPDKKIGFEYLKDEYDTGEPYEIIPVDKPLKADKKSAYVLAMDIAQIGDEEINRDIQGEVENFLAWLKAEGII